MTDPRHEAVAEIERLLARAEKQRLEAGECLELVGHVRLAPGFARRVAQALAAQQSAAAVAGLLELPANVPGVIEGLYKAIETGVTRPRRDGKPGAAMLAMDFRRSRARNFEDTVARARGLFGDTFEVLRVAGRTRYRFMLAQGRGTLAGRAAAAAHDLQWLHGRLARHRGSRLWLNGWCFEQDGKISPAAQVHLVRAWLTFAATQTQTQTQ